MGWVKAALEIFSAVASYFSRKQLIDAGVDKAHAEYSKAQLDKIDRANRARIDAERVRDPWDKANDGR